MSCYNVCEPATSFTGILRVGRVMVADKGPETDGNGCCALSGRLEEEIHPQLLPSRVCLSGQGWSVMADFACSIQSAQLNGEFICSSHKELCSFLPEVLGINRALWLHTFYSQSNPSENNCWE